ncbi:MAG: hypothetical protein OWS74_09175 [Firmicutes bacterium]|nr:hypothetical protein [Bacillota bacterium]
MEQIGHQETPKLWRLVVWSIGAAWWPRRTFRSRARQNIYRLLGEKLNVLGHGPNEKDGPLPMVRAVWLGAELASRTAAFHAFLPPEFKRKMARWPRFLGRRNAQAINTACIAWFWLDFFAQNTKNQELSQ